MKKWLISIIAVAVMGFLVIRLNEHQQRTTPVPEIDSTKSSVIPISKTAEPAMKQMQLPHAAEQDRSISAASLDSHKFSSPRIPVNPSPKNIFIPPKKLLLESKHPLLHQWKKIDQHFAVSKNKVLEPPEDYEHFDGEFYYFQDPQFHPDFDHMDPQQKIMIYNENRKKTAVITNNIIIQTDKRTELLAMIHSLRFEIYSENENIGLYHLRPLETYNLDDVYNALMTLSPQQLKPEIFEARRASK